LGKRPNLPKTMEDMMKLANLTLILILIAAALAGCGGEIVAPAEDPEEAIVVVKEESSETYTSAALNTSYEGALPASSQLAVGTFMLEGTENAVTAEQAAALLSLWQAIESGSLQGDAELNAVLKQIESAMTAEQLAAIAAMQLTGEAMREWMQEQDMSFFPAGGQGGPGGGPGGLGNMTEEERASMRATRQAGGEGGFGPGGFTDMSEEDRAAMRATAEASGMTFPGGGARFGTGQGQVVLLAGPLVELLTQRAGK
jgi:hypothetical protein